MRVRCILLALALAATGAGCVATANAQDTSTVAARTVRITTTTNFITDLARQVGGERVEVDGMFGPGVDPHLYKASAGDVAALADADLVLHSGLHLEGRLGDVLDALAPQRAVVAVTSGIDTSDLIDVGGGHVDPHVWFDVRLWSMAVPPVVDALVRLDPGSAEHYRRRGAAYRAELDHLDRWVRAEVGSLPATARVLVTSHDAFSYFGRRYGFDVVAIQGISTASEATTADIERVASTVAARGVRSVFLESSVPPQTVAAVAAASRHHGHPLHDGGSLFADAAGDEGTPEGTYIGMIRHNTTTIVEGLR